MMSEKSFGPCGFNAKISTGNERSSRIRIFIFLNKNTACVTDVGGGSQTISSMPKNILLFVFVSFLYDGLGTFFDSRCYTDRSRFGIPLFDILILYYRGGINLGKNRRYLTVTDFST